MPQTNLGDFVVTYHSDAEYHDLKREIFTNHIYYREFTTDTPVIVDAGAHIGMATLYFKKLYPHSQIIAIEPHPSSYALLQANVTENNLESVESMQVALVNSDEQQVNLWADSSEEWLQSAALYKGGWNHQQQAMTGIFVSATRLSVILKRSAHRQIDLLKLDVEGAETDILQDLQATNWLQKIEHICIEVHGGEGQLTKVKQITHNTHTLLELHQDHSAAYAKTLAIAHLLRR